MTARGCVSWTFLTGEVPLATTACPWCRGVAASVYTWSRRLLPLILLPAHPLLLELSKIHASMRRGFEHMLRCTRKESAHTKTTDKLVTWPKQRTIFLAANPYILLPSPFFSSVTNGSSKTSKDEHRSTNAHIHKLFFDKNQGRLTALPRPTGSSTPVLLY
jgi:hypothetical protein